MTFEYSVEWPKRFMQMQAEIDSLKFENTNMKKSMARVVGVDASLPEIRLPHHVSGVYFCQAENGFIKIGCSVDIRSRVNHINQGSVLRIDAVGYIQTVHGRDMEKNLHTKFHAYRYRMEWFYPEREITDFIKSVNSARIQFEGDAEK